MSLSLPVMIRGVITSGRYLAFLVSELPTPLAKAFVCQGWAPRYNRYNGVQSGRVS
jgi:hypothetical protein